MTADDKNGFMQLVEHRGDCWYIKRNSIHLSGHHSISVRAMAMLMFRGIRMGRGEHTRNTCGAAKCVNPNHLELRPIQNSMARPSFKIVKALPVEKNSSIDANFVTCPDCLDFAVHERCRQANLRWIAMPVPEFSEPNKFDHKPHSDKRTASLRH